MKNEIKVYFTKGLGWVVEADDFLSTVSTYKQAQQEARKALFKMNEDRTFAERFIGQINYGRKSDRKITVVEWIGVGKTSWRTIKTQRVTGYGKVA